MHFGETCCLVDPMMPFGFRERVQCEFQLARDANHLQYGTSYQTFRDEDNVLQDQGLSPPQYIVQLSPPKASDGTVTGIIVTPI